MIQTAAAVAATWFAMSWLGLEETSWAMISSLLVVQASIDETIQATVFRMLATLLGTALGLATLVAVPGSETLLRLIFATVVINALAMRWPGLRFGVVPATILILSPGDGMDGALNRALAIMLGAVTGFAAAALVWPDRSRNRALRAARQALSTAAKLLACILTEPSQEDRSRIEELHTEFVTHLQQARTTMSGARVGRKLKTGRPISELLREIERLWHGLIILERVIVEDAFNLPADALPKIRPAMGEVGATVAEAIESVRRSLADGRPRPEFGELAKRLAATRGTVQALSASLIGRRTPGTERALDTLLFALDETARHLIEILDTLQPGVGQSKSQGILGDAPISGARPARSPAP